MPINHKLGERTGHTDYEWISDEIDIVRVGGKYRLRKKIGSGSFGALNSMGSTLGFLRCLNSIIIGVVFLGVNLFTRQEVAIKLESIEAEHPQLEHEVEVYGRLAGGQGIPSVCWFGKECNYNALVLQQLGPSLGDLFHQSNGKFSLKTVLLLADQLVCTLQYSHLQEGGLIGEMTQIHRLEYVHSRHLIHRDVKPNNFLMGVGELDLQVHIIDFGLSKQYRDAKTHLHIPYTENHPITGTVAFASINNHLGHQQSRRDDLESLAYILIYFLCGSLPWHGSNGSLHQDKILQMKMTPDVWGLSYPKEFGIFLHYSRALPFQDKPDYAYLRKLFHDRLLDEGYKDDDMFDWYSQGHHSSR
jgi:casein kinase I family protein HRR25